MYERTILPSSFAIYIAYFSFFAHLCQIDWRNWVGYYDKYSTKVEIIINRVRMYENTVFGLKFSYWTLRCNALTVWTFQLTFDSTHINIFIYKSGTYRVVHWMNWMKFFSDNEFPKQVLMNLHCCSHIQIMCTTHFDFYCFNWNTHLIQMVMALINLFQYNFTKFENYIYCHT